MKSGTTMVCDGGCERVLLSSGREAGHAFPTPGSTLAELIPGILTSVRNDARLLLHLGAA